MAMTNKEKVKYILNKYPEVKFDRAEFFLKYLEEYQGVKYYLTYDQFRAFWREFAGVERELREQLKGLLPKKQDSLRLEKANNFRKEYAKKKIN